MAATGVMVASGTDFRGRWRYSGRTPDFLPDRTFAVGADSFCDFRIRRISKLIIPMALEIRLGLSLAADQRPVQCNHRPLADPIFTKRRGTCRIRIRLVFRFQQHHIPCLYTGSDLRIFLHPVNSVVGCAGKRIRLL